MMLHAFAKAECLAPKLFSAAAEEAVARGPATFCPHSLSSLSWSFAASRHPEAERVLDAVGCEAARRAAEFSPEGLAKLAWAFATTGLHHQGLFHSISAEALRRSLRDFNPQVTVRS